MTYENESPFDLGKSKVSLTARITPEANKLLETAWSYLQSEYKLAKFPKQSAVNEVILVGAMTICKHFENKSIPQEIEKIEEITEELQIEIIDKPKTKPKLNTEMPDAKYYWRSFSDIDNPTKTYSYDEHQKNKKDNVQVKELILNRGV